MVSGEYSQWSDYSCSDAGKLENDILEQLGFCVSG